MPQTLLLEAFDEDLSEPNGPSEDFNLGYADGLAAGRQAAQAEAVALEEAFVQAVADLNFTYAEARGQLLQSLTPLFETLTAKVLPHCVHSGFANQIAHALDEAARADIGSPIILHLHPDQHEAVALAISNNTLTVDIREDPTLERYTTWIKHGVSETRLDLQTLLDEITDTLSALNHFEQGAQTHG